MTATEVRWPDEIICPRCHAAPATACTSPTPHTERLRAALVGHTVKEALTVLLARGRVADAAPIATPVRSGRHIPRIWKGDNAKAWSLCYIWSVTRCSYCRGAFTEKNPPTRDHVDPRATGGTFNEGIVLSCQKCNSCRGPAPHSEYRAAVDRAHAHAHVTGELYRRPKYRAIHGTRGGYTIT